MAQSHKKKQFLQNLKNAPYSDGLIEQWLKTFKDEKVINEFMKAAKCTNKFWTDFKKQNKEVFSWSERNEQDMANCYMERFFENSKKQNIPRNLAIAVLLNTDLRHCLIVSDALKIYVDDFGRNIVTNMCIAYNSAPADGRKKG